MAIPPRIFWSTPHSSQQLKLLDDPVDLSTNYYYNITIITLIILTHIGRGSIQTHPCAVIENEWFTAIIVIIPRSRREDERVRGREGERERERAWAWRWVCDSWIGATFPWKSYNATYKNFDAKKVEEYGETLRERRPEREHQREKESRQVNTLAFPVVCIFLPALARFGQTRIVGNVKAKIFHSSVVKYSLISIDYRSCFLSNCAGSTASPLPPPFPFITLEGKKTHCFEIDKNWKRFKMSKIKRDRKIERKKYSKK